MVITTGRNVRISLLREKVPGQTQLVIFSIEDPLTKKITAVLLALSPDYSRYEGVASLPVSGIYRARGDIYDAENRLLVQPARGTIRAEDAPFFSFASFLPEIPAEIQEQLVKAAETVSSTAAPIGIAAGAVQTIALSAQVASLSDLYLLLLKFLAAITGLFRKKRPPWGIVYDSVTKRPLDPAVVSALAALPSAEGAEKNAITDLDGRYGFFLKPGKYSLAANKTHYAFPSKKLSGKGSDEMYDRLYFGGEFRVDADEIVRYNIPMDPIGFDWNEFIKNKERIFGRFSRKTRLFFWFFNSVFYFGLVLAGWTAYRAPSFENAAILSVYLAILIGQEIWARKHHATTIFNSGTGEPIPFAIISLIIPGLGITTKKVVADELGRCYALVEPGTYDVQVEEKLPDESYRKLPILRGMKLKNGVLGESLRVG